MSRPRLVSWTRDGGGGRRHDAHVAAFPVRRQVRRPPPGAWRAAGAGADGVVVLRGSWCRRCGRGRAERRGSRCRRGGAVGRREGRGGGGASAGACSRGAGGGRFGKRVVRALVGAVGVVALMGTPCGAGRGKRSGGRASKCRVELSSVGLRLSDA